MRLIDADALLKTFAEKGIGYSVDVYNAIIDAKKPVAFICDGRACSQACMECQHTTDITHADSFINKNGQYMEKGRTGRWKPCKASIHPYGNDVKCSECGYTMGSSFGFKYCPNCGARMEE